MANTGQTRWTAKITKAGETLLARVPGNSFSFTRAACGSGKVDIDVLENQTAITGYQKALSITSITNAGNATKLRVQLNNDGLQNSFNLHQVGIFAKLGSDSTDVLYMIIQAETPDYIPSATENPNYVNDYVVNAIVKNASSITATIDSAAYVTIGHLDNIEEQMAQVLATANQAVALAEEANRAVALQGASLSDLTGDIADLTFQLAINGLVETDGMKHVVVDKFDGVDDLELISGRFITGKVFI
ncbi:hypothetical protein [Anaerovorax sp. IOR16]|uniref:hypothetical protein n=1 Tax=Anaerovorax sp. IOR16 TaxID=2773458 RepID=UPI0019D1B752|nr:hypothetical protein [Anaerovorax sp. IOR16]